MNVTNLNLSGLPVVHIRDCFDLTEEEFKFFTDTAVYRVSEMGNSVSIDPFILNNPEASRVNIIMKGLLDDYVKKVLEIKNNFEFTNSWLTKCTTNEDHEAHYHSNSMISMVYYIQADSGAFKLYTKPTWCMGNFELDIIAHNMYNSTNWTFDVKSKDLIIFPSHLVHEALPNGSMNDRYILGANAFVKDSFGIDASFNGLRI